MIFMSDEVDNLSRFRLIIPGTLRLNPRGSLGNYRPFLHGDDQSLCPPDYNSSQNNLLSQSRRRARFEFLKIGNSLLSG